MSPEDIERVLREVLTVFILVLNTCDKLATPINKLKHANSITMDQDAVQAGPGGVQAIKVFLHRQGLQVVLRNKNPLVFVF